MPNYRAIARKFAAQYGFDPDVFERQIQQESGFNPNAVSPAGAIGIAQIMPSTAKGWGVNPHNPVAALRAAARNMAQYSRQYGGARNALIAYNAGPGAVGHGLPAETQNYIKVILGGHGEPPTPRGGASLPGTPSLGGSQPSSSGSQYNVFDSLSGLSSNNPTLQHGWELLSRLWDQKHPAATPTSNLDTSSMPMPSGGTVKGGGGKIFELFNNQDAWKNGQRIGAISGHDDHLHLAANPKRINWLARQGQNKFGLTVRELAPFDKVDPVHVKDSYHYHNEAADFGGSQAQRTAFEKWLKHRFGLR